MTTKPTGKGPGSGKDAQAKRPGSGDRAERLKAALRDNLHRRKAQARARKDPNGKTEGRNS